MEKEHNYIPDSCDLWMNPSLRGSLKGDLLHRQPQVIYSNLFDSKFAISLSYSTTCADKIYSNNSGIMLHA